MVFEHENESVPTLVTEGAVTFAAPPQPAEGELEELEKIPPFVTVKAGEPIVLKSVPVGESPTIAFPPNIAA